MILFFFQAEDGIRDVERSRGLGDVYKGQVSQSRSAKYHEPEVRFHPSIQVSRGIGVGGNQRRTTTSATERTQFHGMAT